MRGVRFAALVASLGSALIAACAAGAPGQMSAADETLGVSDDAFSPFREYTAGQRSVSGYPNTVITKLAARVDRKTGATTLLVGGSFVYVASHMRKYESARNARAEPLAIRKISRHRSCRQGSCTFDEKFNIELSEAELRGAPAEGYKIKVFAREGGGTTITVAKADIDRLFAALDKRAAVQ